MLNYKIKMRKLIYGLFLIFLISGCINVQRQELGESTKEYRYGTFSPDEVYVIHPKYHPGDIYALGQQIVLAFKKDSDIASIINTGAEVILMPKIFWNECKNECEKECEPEFTCENKPPMSGEYTFCIQKYDEVFRQCNAECPYICMDEKYKSVSVARHISDGYYSDESYYEHSWDYNTYFKNRHPKKEEYEKTKWQKDRDECMELTYEHETKKFKLEWPQTRINRYHSYYKNCLKERGY